MEFITLTATPPDLIDRTAQALIWLSRVPPPPYHVIGPLGGGLDEHGNPETGGKAGGSKR
ncbi:hypothetical protein AX17_005537 [Amanita inopinata Kibby_2008]|nr:hypothetical protein AX17_005537 [Amanita inopinata Kibby_2008]